VITGEQVMNTVLFDLDGTLLPMDIEAFTKTYFTEISNYFSDLMNGKELISHILISTDIMVKNLEERTNEEVFMEAFKTKIQDNMDTFQKRFDTFYDTAFLKVRETVKDMPLICKSIELLKTKGYKLVIATNPLFPLKAILHRIKWAGLDPDDFIYISSYEKNHYCKPQIKFYEEVLSCIGKEPSECMMIGNDVQEDLIAGNLGIKTFLIRDFMLHRTDEPIKADYSGSYEDFYNFVNTLPLVK
jgi:FMN phosphatase YigB (HAD superfamily)